MPLFLYGLRPSSVFTLCQAVGNVPSCLGFLLGLVHTYRPAWSFCIALNLDILFLYYANLDQFPISLSAPRMGNSMRDLNRSVLYLSRVFHSDRMLVYRFSIRFNAPPFFPKQRKIHDFGWSCGWRVIGRIGLYALSCSKWPEDCLFFWFLPALRWPRGNKEYLDIDDHNYGASSMASRFADNVSSLAPSFQDNLYRAKKKSFSQTNVDCLWRELDSHPFHQLFGFASKT